MNNKLNNNFSLRKLLLTALVAGPLATLPAPLWALPDISPANLTTSANVTVQVVGTTQLNINSPDKAILTWQHFGDTSFYGSATSGPQNTINTGETINYFLPSATSSVLNSVTGGTASTINGAINSVGNVYILNPAGIVLGTTAQVNTGGFFASAVNEPAGLFAINGSLSFLGTSAGSVTVVGSGTNTLVGSQDTAAIQAVGPGNNIYLAGSTVTVAGGKFFGNLFTRAQATGTNTVFGTGNAASGFVSGPVSINVVGTGGSGLAGGSLNVVTNGGNVTLTGAGSNSLTIAGNVSSTTAAVSINTVGATSNGDISQGTAPFIANTTGTVVTLNAGTSTSVGNVTLGAAANDFLTVGATGHNVTLNDSAGNLTLNGANVTNTFNVTASAGSIFQGTGTHSVGGAITLAPKTGSTVNFTGTGNLTFQNVSLTGTIAITSSGDIAFQQSSLSSTGGPLAIVSTGGQITANAITTSSTLTITANSAAGKLTAKALQGATGAITVAGDISVTADTTTNALYTGTINNGSQTFNVVSTGGNITAAVLSSAATMNVTATVGTLSVGTSIVASATNGPRMTLTSANGIVLPTTTATVLTVNSTGGSITQSGIITSTSSATFNAAADISLGGVGGVGNALNVLVLQGGASGSAVNYLDINDVTIGGGTNTKVGTTITTTTGNITLGTQAIDSLAFASNLTLSANGAGANIITSANSLAVFGNVTLTALGTAQLGNNIFGNAANYTYGQVNATAGTLNVYENTTLNLGTVSVTTLTAASLSSDIVNSGQIKATGTATFSAHDIFTPGNVSLTNPANQIATAIIGNAKDFTLVNNGATTVTAGSPVVNGKTGTGTTSVTVIGTPTASPLTLNTQAGGDYGTVSFTAPGNVTITDPNGLTLQNLSNSSANNGSFVNISAAGPIVLGSGINLGGTGVTTITSTYNASSTVAPGITDSAAGIRIFGETVFKSDGNIKITNAGHSFGTVSLTTTGVAQAATGAAAGTTGLEDITYTEGGTISLKTVSVGTGTYPGSLVLTSTGGAIVESATSTITVPNVQLVATTVSLTAGAGGVSLASLVGNAITPAINIAAVGNSGITQSTQSVALGNITVTGGTFGVDTSAAAGMTVSQVTGSSAKIYGNTSITTQGGKITIPNVGNNFGGLTLNSAGGAATTGADVAIAEAGIMNLLSVNTGTLGKFTALSEAGAIVQTGSLGVIVGGATSLTAPSITLNGAANLFGGNNAILVSSAGNVSITDGSAITALNGNTSIGGSLTLKNIFSTSTVAGTLKDTPGNLTISGPVTLDVGTNNPNNRIDFTNATTSSFGALTFRGGAVTITETQTLNMGAGSTATGQAILSSVTGSIVTTGGGNFQNTLTLNAAGNITISNPIFVQGFAGTGLIFQALGAVDLSALSLAGNLNSIAPTNLRAGSYKAPSP